MNSVENLTTYNKFINLIKEGLLLIPDLLLSKTAKELHILDCESQVEYMNKEKEVILNAKKVIISYRGSIRDYTIDGKECEDLAKQLV